MKDWFKKLFKKDEFLEEVRKHDGLYQKFFEKLIRVSDDKVWCKFILSPNYHSSDEALKTIELEENKMEATFREAENSGLNSIVLLIIYLQWATADIYEQKPKKPRWISIVLNRKPTDSFPDHNAIFHFLSTIGYIA